MKIFTKAAAGALLVVATTFPTAALAGAESYTNPDTPHHPGTDTPDKPDTPGGEVLPSDSENPVEEGTSSPGGPAGAEVLPSSDEAPAAAESAPSGTLPFTGGDVVGMPAIGLGAVAVGTVLVRRSRKDGPQTA
jgi:hypothetical protein